MNSSFSNFIQQELNPEQRQAVTPATGILLVCAGAGSGKTRVITARIAYLIKEHKSQPHTLLALTFTNKAAREMKERVMHFLGTTEQLPFVGTFHSYCLRLLKTHSNLLPFETFSLLDDDDQERIIRGLLNRYGLTKKISLKQVTSFISRKKNALDRSAEPTSNYTHDKLLQELFYLYEQEKAAAHCLDFDDLLTYTLALLEKNPQFKQSLQRQLRHVLIDEYQDTNQVQHALLKALTQDTTGAFALDSLCIVGDEDQSIYSWRGATVTNMLNFKLDFPDARAITIDKNYRSVQPILELANFIIKHNSARNPKNLWSSRHATDRIRLLSCSSSYQEAELIALFLKQSAQLTPLHEHALLYRSHFQSRALEEALIRHNIAYKIMGGIQFYDRQEIKDLLAYLRLIINPFDRLAFFRSINTPARGLGEKFEQQCTTAWQLQAQARFQDILAYLSTTEQLTKIKQEAVANFLAVFQDLSSATRPTQALNTVIQRINYFGYLKDHFEKEEAQAKIDNVKELLNGAAYFEEKQEPVLELFLEEIALLQEQLNSQDQNYTNCVRLMTLHASKGLEFATVILPGLEETILPSNHALYNPETLEEERRLLYVGITRAQERLLITQARTRYAYGTITDQRPSRFIAEFSQELIQHDDCAHWSQQQHNQYFSNWLTHSNTSATHTPEYTRQNTAPAATQDKRQTTYTTDTAGWHQHQVIYHQRFGQGTIEQIEQKSSTTVYLTVRFTIGLKKVDAHFIQKIPFNT